MSFRYVNPGYAELLTHRYNDSIVTVRNKNYNPQNEVAFSARNSATDNYITLPYAPTELYCSFNIIFTDRNYFNAGYSGIMFKDSSNANRTGLHFYNTNAYNPLNINMYYNNVQSSTSLTLSNYTSAGIQNFWFHIKMKTADSAENGLTEFSMDKGKTIISQEFDTVPNLYKNLRIYTPVAYLSNIIISDEYIDPKEQVIKLPISSTQSDMTFDSETGIYTATANNQSLLSAVNVNSLVEEFGTNSPVTGIVQVGNPAYKTAEGLSSLTAFTKNNSGTVNNYGTYSLSDDTSSVIADSRKIENMTIADLENLQFGWRAGG